MTRINSNIPPKSLCDQHLNAEYREIVRTIALAKNKFKKIGSLEKLREQIPQQFTLGSGHVSFFYDKLKFIRDRFNSLRQEMLDRGMQANMFINSEQFRGILELYNDWSASTEDNELIIDRIYERAKGKNRITFSGSPVTSEQYLHILNN